MKRWFGVALLLSGAAWAFGETTDGTLRSFERVAVEKTRPSDQVSIEEESRSETQESWMDALLSFFFDRDAPESCSAASRNRGPAVEITPTAPAPRLKPYARIDLAHQWVRPDVRAVDMRAEGGYGVLGLEGRLTRFREASPAVRMDLSYVRAVAHIPLTPRVQLGLGLGSGQLVGEGRTSGFSAAVPLDVRVTRAWSLELYPSWTKLGDRTLSDMEAAARWGAGRILLRLGYRRLRAGEQTLSGPTAGLSISF